MDRLGLVIPLYDEVSCCEREIHRLVDRLQAAHVPFRLVLVDNGSRDGTGALIDRIAASTPSIRTVHIEHNAGYGGGILAGLAQTSCPIVGWHWGDGQIDPQVVVQTWRLLRAEHLDIAKATRIRREDGLDRAIISRVYRWVTRHRLGLPDTDINGCPKIMTRTTYERLTLQSTSWLLDLELMWKAHHQGLRVGTVSTTMHPRLEGHSKVHVETIMEFIRGVYSLRRGRLPWDRPL